MSYQTYTTEAIVCGSYDRLTADRTYLLFTETAGMVFAIARSAREERSKQRYALQDFTHVRVSLVKGKSGWRIGSVEPLINYYTTAGTRAARGTVVGVVALLRRLLTGEDVTTPVFDDTVAALSASATVADTTSILELFTLRTLAHLGYVAEHEELHSFLEPTTNWQTITTPLPPRVGTVIKDGLAASHL